MIPTIHEPTSETSKTAKTIDHILTNHFIDVNFKIAFFKVDISDHFPVCIISSKETLVESKHTYPYKRVITNDVIKSFNHILYESG